MAFTPCKGHCDFRHNCVRLQDCTLGVRETLDEQVELDKQAEEIRRKILEKLEKKA